MSEQILSDERITIKPGVNRELDSDEAPVVRMILTTTRLIIAPWNDAADELIDGELTFDPYQMRDFIQRTLGVGEMSTNIETC